MIENLNITMTRPVSKFSSQSHAYISPPSIDKIPFIILLHSLGKNEKECIKLAELLPKTAFVLSVRAPIEWRVDGENSFAWFDIKGPLIESFTKETDIIDSISYLIEVIENVKKDIPNLDDPIIIGFSQGGIVGLTMSLENYFRVKGLWCHCGFYEEKLNKNFENIDVNIVMTNGIHDYVIPQVWAERSYEVVRKKCKKFEGRFINCGHEVNFDLINDIKLWLIDLL